MNIISLSTVATTVRAGALVDTELETADPLASRKQTRDRGLFLPRECE